MLLTSRPCLKITCRILTILGLISLTVGCQISTNTGMYRGYIPWRRFRDPQLVLERAPLNDEEPSLWGPRVKTHALRWHDRGFNDARYTYSPRPKIRQTSSQDPETGDLSQSRSGEPSPAPPSGANHPVRLTPRAPIPLPLEPEPPRPGALTSPTEQDSNYPSIIDQPLETPLPPPAPVTTPGGTKGIPFMPLHPETIMH